MKYTDLTKDQKEVLYRAIQRLDLSGIPAMAFMDAVILHKDILKLYEQDKHRNSGSS